MKEGDGLAFLDRGRVVQGVLNSVEADECTVTFDPTSGSKRWVGQLSFGKDDPTLCRAWARIHLKKLPAGRLPVGLVAKFDDKLMRVVGAEPIEDGSEKSMRMLIQDGDQPPKATSIYGDLLQAMLMRLEENKAHVAPFKITPSAYRPPTPGSAVVLGNFVGVVQRVSPTHCAIKFPAALGTFSVCSVRWDTPAIQEALRRGVAEDVSGLDQQDVERVTPRDVIVSKDGAASFVTMLDRINLSVLNEAMTMEEAVNKQIFKSPAAAAVENGAALDKRIEQELREDGEQALKEAGEKVQKAARGLGDPVDAKEESVPPDRVTERTKIHAMLDSLHNRWIQLMASVEALRGVANRHPTLEAQTLRLEKVVDLERYALSHMLSAVLSWPDLGDDDLELINRLRGNLVTTSADYGEIIIELIKANNGGTMPEKAESTEAPSLATRVKKVAKRTATATAYRVAASQISQTVRATVAEALAKQGGGTKREITTRRKQISKFFDTEIGLGVIQFLLGSGMELIPGMTPDGKLDRLADELRISGFTKVVDTSASAVLGPMRDMIRAVIETLPDTVEEGAELAEGTPRIRAHVPPETHHEREEHAEHAGKGNNRAAHA